MEFHFIPVQVSIQPKTQVDPSAYPQSSFALSVSLSTAPFSPALFLTNSGHLTFPKLLNLMRAPGSVWVPSSFAVA